MPSPIGITQMLRDDLLAQLRIATGPATTRRLQHAASPIPAAGFTGRWRPLREQVYTTLRRLQAEGLVESIATCGREVAWRVTPTGAAHKEIATLAEMFAIPAVSQQRTISADAADPARPTQPGQPT